MSPATTLVINVVGVAAAVSAFFLLKHPLVRRLIVLDLFLFVAEYAAFGGGSLRTHAERARSAGKSEQFVEGLAEMNHAFVPVRGRVLLGALGLFIIGMAGAGRRVRPKDSE